MPNSHPTLDPQVIASVADCMAAGEYVDWRDDISEGTGIVGEVVRCRIVGDFYFKMVDDFGDLIRWVNANNCYRYNDGSPVLGGAK